MKHTLTALLALATLAACSGDDGGPAGQFGTSDSEQAGFGVSSSPGTTSTDGSSADNGSTDGSSADSGSTDAGSFDTSGATVGNTEFFATHRNGQTFLVWDEVGAGVDYNVYRHSSPITSNNISAATLLTDRWGPVDDNTSFNRFARDDVPANFVINDLGQPLTDSQALFVHTTQDDQQGVAYYAVTAVNGGREDRSIFAGVNAITEPVIESIGTPRPVLVSSVNDGKGRYYTQYMDYANWNPTLKGYAYNFSVALPADYNPSRSYSLRVYLHAFGEQHKFVEQTEYDWSVIQLFPSDPGPSIGSVHTWWYGFAKDHNYLTRGSKPNSGAVENFTEQRVLASVDFLIDDGQFNVDSDLVHVYGHSMGASGSLTYGMRYPSVFAGIYASEPMTNYPDSPLFQDNFTTLWGSQSSNLPIVNNGRNNAAISRYDSNGSESTRVWNWMNHQEQLLSRRGDRFSYLMVDHGKEDQVIEWATQGKPMPGIFTEARVGFSASSVGGVGHSWLAFNSVVNTVFGFSHGALEGWRYPKDLGFPAIGNATSSGAIPPPDTGDDRFNTNIEWATPLNNFAASIVDSANRYEISLRSLDANQAADITPRNTNLFRPAPGTQCSWTATSLANDSNIGAGNGTVDAFRLLTIPSVLILSNGGTRLAINCP